jgi:DNA polymerase III alpha subunit (gram-positive type)
MKQANFIVFDCETGGFDETKNPITQIALLVIDGKTLKELGRFEMYIKPYDGLEITKSALDVTGLKMIDINKGYDKKEAVDILCKFFKKHVINNRPENRPVLVGHNVQFDMRFLFYIFESCKKDLFSFVSDSTVCTMAQAKMCYPEATSLKLEKVCEMSGIKLNDAHKAMNDVVATTDVFRYFINKMRNSEASIVSTETKKSRLKFQF